jgi:hypothetical protein
MRLYMQHNSNQSNRIIIDFCIRGNVREIKERKLLIATKEKNNSCKKKFQISTQNLSVRAFVCVDKFLLTIFIIDRTRAHHILLINENIIFKFIIISSIEFGSSY